MACMVSPGARDAVADVISTRECNTMYTGIEVQKGDCVLGQQAPGVSGRGGKGAADFVNGGRGRAGDGGVSNAKHAQAP